MVYIYIGIGIYTVVLMFLMRANILYVYDSDDDGLLIASPLSFFSLIC